MGELGYEFYIPTEFSHIARDARTGAIQAAGLPVVHCGMVALEPQLFGNEPILCDGTDVGHVRAGAFGPTLGASVGLGMIELAGGVTAERSRADRSEVRVNDRLVPAALSRAPLYDPKG